MALTINSNIQSLRVQRNLDATTTELSKVYERLSSGLRIVRASDDAAGLSIADRLKADQRIAGQAIRNTNDAISLVSIADGALSETGNILTRMVELAQQAANGTLSITQRAALSTEFVALGSEIGRIAVATTYNGISLLSGSTSISIQVGLDATSNSQITYAAVNGTLTSLGLGSGSTLSFSITGSTSLTGQAAAITALDAVRNAISSLSTVRGTLGAADSRFNSVLNTLQIQRENFANAESQIRDADVAVEVARMVRLQIVQQAATSILAQANQQPALVLDLLGAR